MNPTFSWTPENMTLETLTSGIPNHATVAEVFRSFDMIPPDRSSESVEAWLTR